MTAAAGTRLRAVALRGQGFSYSEIARRLGVPKTTVYQWLNGGRS